jgi:preprotein translocase subunit SecG
MYTLVSVIHIIVSIVMVIAVLLQVGKGATMGSTFGGGASSQTIFGSAGPATFLTKITVGCAVIFMLTSMYLTYLSGKTRISSIMSNVPAVTVPPQGKPAAPAQAVPPASATQPGKAPLAPAPQSAPAK